MNAVILAGGFGSRLMPFTRDIPKPMLNVANVPMIDYTVSQLAHFGINDIVFTLAFQPETIINWTLGYKDIKCHYNIESTPLGTCGGVKDAIEYLNEQFFVLSGDGISDIDLLKMHETHTRVNADITMAVTEVRDPSLYGVVDTDKHGMVKSFVEKPQNYVGGAYINCGVYLINKDIMQSIPNCKYDFSKDLFPDMLKNNRRLATYVHDGYWNDVGNIESYYHTNLELKNRGVFFKQAKHSQKKQQYKNKNFTNSIVCNSSKIFGTVYNSIVGSNCQINKGVTLENCIVLDGALVTTSAKNSIIDSQNCIQIALKDQHNKIPYNQTKIDSEIFYNS